MYTRVAIGAMMTVLGIQRNTVIISTITNVNINVQNIIMFTNDLVHMLKSTIRLKDTIISDDSLIVILPLSLVGH